MEQQVSTEFPRPAERQYQESHTSKTVAVSAAPPRSKTRARIIQIVSIVLLVVLLIVLWRFLGDRAASTAGTGRGGRAGGGEVVPVEVAPVTQQDVPIQIKSIGNVEPMTTVPFVRR